MEDKRKYYQKEIETMPAEEIKSLQSEKLARQIKHVYGNVAYYRNLMDNAGVKPEDIRGIEDLHKLPFTSKHDLRDSYPYGFLAVPLDDCVRIHSTSGTTGKRVIAFYTQHDLDMWSDCTARALVAAGIDKGDILQISYGYGLFTGGAGINDGSHKVGCLTLPMSSGNTDRQLMFMNDLGATALCCTPSYAAFLAESLKEQGYAPEQIPLKYGIFGAEPWTEEIRKSIEKDLGIKAYDIYGLTEITGPGVAYECENQNGMHINEDHFLAEIIDPDTGEALPEGTWGELVFTCLDKEAFPMIRYRTRDICMLTREKCSCGRTFIKMAKPKGRSDDMLIIKGVNVFPSQIETVLANENFTGNYQIVIDRVNNADIFDLYAELPSEQFDDTVKAIYAREKKLVEAMADMLGIAPKVHLVPPKTIERSEGKALRVIDKRKLV